MRGWNPSRDLRDTAWLLGRLGRKVAVSVVPIPLHFWISMARGRFITSVRGVPKQVRRNIEHARGSIEASQMEQIAIDYWRFVQSSYLWRILPHLPGFRRSDRWQVDGLEHLDSALANGRGVLLLTAHLGYPHLIPDFLALRGYEVRQLIAELERLEKKNRVDAWLEQASSWKKALYRKSQLYSESIRASDIVASLDVRPILAAMESNEILLVAGDGLRATEFKTFSVLGNDYPIPTGFVKIALLTGAAVLPIFSVPQPGGIRTIIHPSLRLDPKAGIETNLQGYVKVLNDQLQRTPHLWLRWKRADWFEKARNWAAEAKTDPFRMKPAWLMED